MKTCMPNGTFTGILRIVSFEALYRSVGACRPTFLAQEGKSISLGKPGYGGRNIVGAVARFSCRQGNGKGIGFAGGENAHDS
jgi:hypothetical protein